MIHFDFSKTQKPVGTAMIALNAVYKLDADQTYHVTKKLDKENKELVALRTVGGSGMVEIEGVAPKKVMEGSLLVFEHAKVRQYHTEQLSWAFWWFEFNISGPLHFPLNKVVQVESLKGENENCEECLELLRRMEVSAHILASATLSTLMYQWMLQLQFESQKSIPHHEELCRVIDYLYVHVTDNISIRHMAEIAGFSERRFREVFKNFTGMSPKKYYESLKMNMAAELLRNTSMHIVEISNQLGYSSQFHFSKAFMKFYHVSPRRKRSEQ